MRGAPGSVQTENCSSPDPPLAEHYRDAARENMRKRYLGEHGEGWRSLDCGCWINGFVYCFPCYHVVFFFFLCFFDVLAFFLRRELH